MFSSIESLEPRIAPATFVVTTLSDSGPGSLRDAVAKANVHVGPDVITFRSGLTGTITVNGGQMEVTDPLSIVGPGAGKLTLDALQQSRFFNVSDGSDTKDSPFSVSGLTFLRGRVVEPTSDGGAIICLESLKIKGCTFLSNEAGGSSGAVFLRQGQTGPILNVSIRDCSFLLNSSGVSGGGDGGAISIQVKGSITVKDSVFGANDNNRGSGGGASLAAGPGKTLLVQNTRFLGNEADFDAGGATIGGTTVIIRDCIFNGNSAERSLGGALRIVGTKVLIESSTFTQNEAHGRGGALFSDGVAVSLVVRDCTFIANTAESSGGTDDGGGAMYVQVGEEDVTRIVRCLISDNNGASGGGIFATSRSLGAGSVDIVASRITGNHASEDGGGVTVATSGLAATPDLNVARSKIVGNVAAAGEGGGIAVFGDSKFSMSDSQMIGNIAAITGGGIALFNTQPSTIVDSIIAQNRAGSGGGVGASVMLVMRGSKVLDNLADLGGGIGTTANLQLIASLISANLAIQGGGISHSLGTDVVLTGSKVFRNISLTGGPIAEV